MKSTDWPIRLYRAAICLGLLVAPASLAGQQVIGRVLERGGGGPVAGAMVRLTGASGEVGRGWLTAEDGRFRLVPPSPGSYDLRVERIGFTGTVVSGIEVQAGGIVSLDVVVAAEPITLEGLQVQARGGRCEAMGDAGGTQRLWDEARKALEAATWTEEQGQLRFLVSVWDRQISPRTGQILFEESEQRETFGANSVQSLPPEELVADGYVQMQPGFVFWYAPDAAVLLSDAFRTTHCFRIAEPDDDEPELLGLAFEPDEDRERPDVEGVIWVHAPTGRLDRVEFRYTNLRMAGSNRANGLVRFAELPDGRWIVRDWFIQAPMQNGRVGTPGAVRRGTGMVIHEVGNRVEAASGGELQWDPDVATASISGIVFDSVSTRVLAGAEVRVAGRGARARTDLDGAFELDGIAAGRVRLTFTHPDLDSLGVQAGWSALDIGPGEHVTIELAVPRWETLLAWSCGERGAGALVGLVRDRDGALVSGARVELVGGGLENPLAERTDVHGGFVFCEPGDGVTRVRASRGRAVSPPVETRVVEGGFSQADLVLPPAPERVALVPGALRPALVGTVMAQGSRAPLEGVSVELLDIDGETITTTVTGDDGTFRVVLDDGEPLVHLGVSRLGYAGAVSEALDLSEGTRRVEVLLPTEAIELPPVLVRVEGLDPRLEAEGFYQRATQNPGLFIRRDDIEAVAPARTSDLLERAPGVRSWTDPLSGDLRRRIVFTRNTLSAGDRCFPAVFVDNEMLRVGGARDEPEAPAIEGIEPPPGEYVPALDELVPPHEIEAVEMYPTPGQVPARFTGLGTRCGVIVVWTRQGGGR